MPLPARLLLGTVLALALAAPASAIDEELFVPLETGATLAWKRQENKPAQLKLVKVGKKSEAEGLGYRKGDEIIAIGSEPLGDQTLAAFLRLSRTAESFRVRRKKEELDLPPLFRVAAVIEGSRQHKLQPGERPPELVDALTLEGREITLEEFTGKIVVINFWATWCHPCMTELPYLRQIQKLYADRGLVVVSVNMDDDASKWRKFLEANALPFVHVRVNGSGSKTATKYGIVSIPANIFLDRQGIIRKISTGYGAPDLHSLERFLRRPVIILLENSGSILTIVNKD